jgi:hypothetical protein
MPKVQVSSDDGRVMMLEWVSAATLEEEHFRNCLAERIAWAASDAEGEGERAAAAAGAPTGSGRRPA